MMNRVLFLILINFFALNGLLNAQCTSGDCKNGYGKITYDSGMRYEGDFKNGKRHGLGTVYLQNGSWYRGAWADDFPNGRGIKHNVVDGTVQDGIWEKGKFVKDLAPKPIVVAPTATERDEVPELEISSGDPNCMHGDCLEGIGVYKFANGDIYEGHFHEGHREGEGIYRYSNGDRYEGQFKNDRYHGLGTFFAKNGETRRGTWNEDAYLGEFAGSDTDVKTFNPESMKVWAVIVGVGNYTAMPKLNYTDDDAKLLADFLKSPQGGGLTDEHLKILIDQDATMVNITNTMAETFGKAGPNDLVILYFSGHGLPGYFLPIDYDGTNNMLNHGIINTILLDSPAKYKLCLADACHSGSLTVSNAKMRSTADQTMKKYYNAFKDIRAGVALIMSSRTEEYSLESNGLKQGLFSHFLIRGLRGEGDADKDKIVTITELYNFIQGSVSEMSAGFQNPVISGNFDVNMPVGVIED